MATAAPLPLEEKIRRMTPISLPESERSRMAAIHETLEGLQARCELVGPSGERVPLPESLFYVLERVAEVLATGGAITVVPVGKEMTTQQAANLLNVSRQYLVRLLERKEIPFTFTGKHRRLKVEDVLAYKESRDRKSRRALRNLTRLSQEYGGYDELK